MACKTKKGAAMPAPKPAPKPTKGGKK